MERNTRSLLQSAASAAEAVDEDELERSPPWISPAGGFLLSSATRRRIESNSACETESVRHLFVSALSNNAAMAEYAPPLSGRNGSLHEKPGSTVGERYHEVRCLVQVYSFQAG